MQRQNIVLQWEWGEKHRDDSTLRKTEVQEKAEETNQLEGNEKLQEKRKRDMNSIRWEREWEIKKNGNYCLVVGMSLPISQAAVHISVWLIYVVETLKEI